ncbi:MAG: hypothetical protein D6728_15990 [Cyanobacteria bacterium J055]|nr:MAG: hypothetical protein D6728_15990 [Cyanobacteria bacterium J055]
MKFRSRWRSPSFGRSDSMGVSPTKKVRVGELECGRRRLGTGIIITLPPKSGKLARVEGLATEKSVKTQEKNRGWDDLSLEKNVG